MYFLYYTYGFLSLLFSLSILVIFGFLITWIVGKIVKNKRTSSVGKRGTLITLLIALILFVLYLCSFAGYQHIANERNERFDHFAEKYKSTYIVTAYQAEKVGNAEADDWEKAINDSSDSDDFDPDTVIEKTLVKHADQIDDVSDNMKKIDSYARGMSKNETPDRNTSKYKKSYNSLKKMTDLVTSPSGSYNSFSDNLSKYDQQTANAYEDMK